MYRRHGINMAKITSSGAINGGGHGGSSIIGEAIWRQLAEQMKAAISSEPENGAAMENNGVAAGESESGGGNISIMAAAKSWRYP